jgi:hypothetical protein
MVRLYDMIDDAVARSRWYVGAAQRKRRLTETVNRGNE